MRSFRDGSQKFAVIIFNIFWNKTIAKSPITEDFCPLIKIRALKCHSLISINLCKEISLFIFFGACKLQNLPIAYFLCAHFISQKRLSQCFIFNQFFKKKFPRTPPPPPPPIWHDAFGVAPLPTPTSFNSPPTAKLNETPELRHRLTSKKRSQYR